MQGPGPSRGWRPYARDVLAVHITPVENLPGILARGGLWSDSRFKGISGQPAIVTDASIKAKRARFPVAGTGRTLADYVPFFFVPCNPMTYRLCHENDPDRLLFIVVDTDDYLEDEDVVFTDRHALSHAKFFRGLGSLPKTIDVASLRRHRSWVGDEDLAKRLQAEFLVWMTARKRKFRGIAAASPNGCRLVEEQLAAAGWHDAPPVKAKPAWFFR